MKFNNIFFFLAVLFALIFSMYPMEPESESVDEDIEAQVSEPQDVRQPMNINVNIMGFDPETEEGQKKMAEIMEIVYKLVHEGKQLATAKKTEPEPH